MDDVDELLTPRDSGENSPNSNTWIATTRILRRRRWIRRGRAGLFAAICFAAGALVMYRPAPTTNPNMVAAAPREALEPEPAPIEAPRRLERWAANARGEKQRNLYRRAGDGFLKSGDEVAAVRCYRKALDGGSPNELAVNTEDTWMMMFLKIARHKE
jgi:hypothetical protein